MSRHSFPKVGPFLSRQKTLYCDRVSKGGVATESFLSQPSNQAYTHDRALGAHNRALGPHTISLGTCMSTHTSDGVTRATVRTTDLSSS